MSTKCKIDVHIPEESICVHVNQVQKFLFENTSLIKAIIAKIINTAHGNELETAKYYIPPEGPPLEINNIPQLVLDTITGKRKKPLKVMGQLVHIELNAQNTHGKTLSPQLIKKALKGKGSNAQNLEWDAFVKKVPNIPKLRVPECICDYDGLYDGPSQFELIENAEIGMFNLENFEAFSNDEHFAFLLDDYSRRVEIAIARWALLYEIGLISFDQLITIPDSVISRNKRNTYPLKFTTTSQDEIDLYGDEKDYYYDVNHFENDKHYSMEEKIQKVMMIPNCRAGSHFKNLEEERTDWFMEPEVSVSPFKFLQTIIHIPGQNADEYFEFAIKNHLISKGEFKKLYPVYKIYYTTLPKETYKRQRYPDFTTAAIKNGWIPK